MKIFNPRSVLDLIHLRVDELAWLFDQADKGNSWFPPLADPSVRGILANVWHDGAALWDSTETPSHRIEMLEPQVPIWEALALGWAQVRLRNSGVTLNRRITAWAYLLRGFTTGAMPPFRGAADHDYRAALAQVQQLVQIFEVEQLPDEGKRDPKDRTNHAFTVAAFGLLCGLLLDPDQDLTITKARRAIAFLDRTRGAFKSEDVATARKILAEIADPKDILPGEDLPPVKVDWKRVISATNVRLDKLRQNGQKARAVDISEKMGMDHRQLTDILMGLPHDLPNLEVRLLLWKLGNILDINLFAYVVD